MRDLVGGGHSIPIADAFAGRGELGEGCSAQRERRARGAHRPPGDDVCPALIRQRLGSKPSRRDQASFEDCHHNVHFDTTQCRSLRVWKVACLRNYPDHYLCESTSTHRCVQVANTVPALLAHQFADAVCAPMTREPLKSLSPSRPEQGVEPCGTSMCS